MILSSCQRFRCPTFYIHLLPCIPKYHYHFSSIVFVVAQLVLKLLTLPKLTAGYFLGGMVFTSGEIPV